MSSRLVVRRCLTAHRTTTTTSSSPLLLASSSSLLPSRPSFLSIPFTRSASLSRSPPPPTTSAPSSRASKSTPPPPKKDDKPPRDEDIPHPIISLVDPSTSSLLPPASLKDILISLDRTRFLIQLVDPSHDPPICKIIDKKEVYAKEKAKKKSGKTGGTGQTSGASASGGPPKELHLSWGVSPHDLNHKLAKGKELMEKGHRLTVYVTTKKGSVTPTATMKSDVLTNIQDAMNGVGKLAKPPANDGAQAVLEFERISSS